MRTRGVSARRDLEQAEILLRAKARKGLRRVRGRDDCFDEEFGNLFGGGAVYLSVDADDATEGRDRIGLERAAVGVEDRRARRSSAGVGVLDDDRGGI